MEIVPLCSHTRLNSMFSDDLNICSFAEKVFEGETKHQENSCAGEINLDSSVIIAEQR